MLKGLLRANAAVAEDTNATSYKNSSYSGSCSLDSASAQAQNVQYALKLTLATTDATV